MLIFLTWSTENRKQYYYEPSISVRPIVHTTMSGIFLVKPYTNWTVQLTRAPRLILVVMRTPALCVKHLGLLDFKHFLLRPEINLA